MSTNVSKEKRNILIKKIEDIKTFIQSSPQDDNTAQLLAYIADIEKDIKGKKYGLVFEEHRESIDETLENNLPVLVEDESLFIDNGGQMNFIIEGDNLASLKLLEKTHKGKIDLIYIDPPYNTEKNDFVYDDNFVVKEDGFRHSKWLSFMQKRLSLAHKLLSKKGIIAISIDDHEQAQLKLLCSEIFGEENFLLHTCVNRTSEIATNYTIQKHEYIYFYVKDINSFSVQTREKFSISRGTVGNENQTMPVILFPAGLPCYGIADGTYETTRKLEGSRENIENFDPIIVENGKLKNSVRLKARWRSSNDMRNFFKNNCQPTLAKINGEIVEIYFENDRFNPQIKKKTYEKIPSVFLENKRGSEDLKKVDLDGKFNFPKSVILLEFVLSCVKKSVTILDFFAGSGTTGHAVMKLNAEDGGQRKFILCTNNENNICRDVTYERIKRVIAKEDYKASLKYFKVEYLPISDKLYYEYADELLLHIRELVELENGINFNDNAEIAIVLTEKELDEFTQNIPETCKAIYVGHNVLPTEEQEKIFAKRKIKVNVIPEYYYRDLEG